MKPLITRYRLPVTLQMSNTKQSFGINKKEKVKSRILIDQLFKKGNSKVFFPFRIVWTFTSLPHPVPIQFAVSVPKRKYPRAVDRIRFKRQMREVYRLNKHLLTDNIPANQEEQLAVMFLFISNTPVPYKAMDKQMKKALKFLKKQYKITPNQEEN